MPRKSQALRLSQATKLYTAYQEADISEGKVGRFIRDMISKLERGAVLSKGQRNWLDNLIEEGVPKCKGDPDLVNRIESACNVAGMQEYDIKILKDFLRTIKRGWNLSEKQSSWMENLLSKSEKIAIEGPYIPDETIKVSLEKCVKLSMSYNSMYWSTHGGTAKALRNVKEWLESGGYIDEWSVNKLTKAMGSKLRELDKSPYVSPGDLVWCRWIPGDHRKQQKDIHLGVVSTPAKISDRGEIVYGVLVDGKLLELTKERIAKRRFR